MHKKKNNLLVILLIGLGILIGKGNEVKAQEKADPGRIYVKVQVDGLACPFCAYGVEKKIKKLEGAKHYEVNIEKGLVYFDIPEAKHSSKPELKDKVRKKVKEAGFKARKIYLKDQPFDQTKNSKE